MFFAGLRTLCIATTEVNEEFYEEWKHTYYKASTSIQNRDKKLEEAAELIERVRQVSFHLFIHMFICMSVNIVPRVHSFVIFLIEH